MDLLKHLQSVVILGEIDLGELDGAYVDPETGESLKVQYRQNWTKGQKTRQRELQEESLAVQRKYARLKEVVGDQDAWDEAKAEADAASDENWLHWAQWWAGIFYVDGRPMTREEVVTLCDALPDAHWIWLTSQASIRASDYEKDSLKKASAARSATSGARRNRRRKSGAKRESPES